MVAIAVFLATVAAGIVLLPHDALQYWGGVAFEAHRAGGYSRAEDQSIHGAIARLVVSTSAPSWWVLVAAFVAAVGMTVAVTATRRGDRATGFSICAVTGLLISPISWEHHWVLAVPALLLLVLVGYERRSKLLLAGAATLAFVGYAWPAEHVDRVYADGLYPGLPAWLIADPYVILGLLAICLTGVNQLRPSWLRRPVGQTDHAPLRRRSVLRRSCSS